MTRAQLKTNLRKPLFGRYGRRVVASVCTWEIVALVPSSPVPTVSETVRRFPVFGWTLLALLAHHWYVEQMVAELVSGLEAPEN